MPDGIAGSPKGVPIIDKRSKFYSEILLFTIEVNHLWSIKV